LRVKALGAHTQSIDASCAQSHQLLTTQSARVGFQGNLGIFIDREIVVTGVQDATNLRDAEKAEGTTTKKDGARATWFPTWKLCQCARHADLGEQGTYIWLSKRKHTGIGIEIAIVTACMAKGDVYIQGDGLQELLNGFCYC